MKSKLDKFSAFSGITTITSFNLRILPIVVLMVASCVGLFVDAAWSTQAMDRLKAQKAAQTSSPSQLGAEFKYKVAVFYGTRQERRQNRLCEKLKCEFVSTGCLVTELDPPPPFACFSIWSEMTFPEAGECLYKPCENYNQVSTCVLNSDVCIEGQGQLVDFGLCKDGKRCCLFPGSPRTNYRRNQDFK